MKEKYWDPLNKAAILVTIFTGIPAFMTFIGLPFFAAIILGILAISSLVFALIRGRLLKDKAIRFAKLNKSDEHLISEFNTLIASKNFKSQSFLSLINKALCNIKEYVESDASCNAAVSIREIKSNLDVVQLISSSSHGAQPAKINLQDNTGFSASWYGHVSDAIFPQDKSIYKNFHIPEFTMNYRTVAIFPIMTRTNDCEDSTGLFEWWGFLVVDIDKKRKISDEMRSILYKYAHLFFLLFSSTKLSLDMHDNQNELK